MDNEFAMPIPDNAIQCDNYRNAFGIILFRIITMITIVENTMMDNKHFSPGELYFKS